VLDHFQRQPNLNKNPLNRDQASALGLGLFCLGMLNQFVVEHPA
jgi:hypothetical protein